MHDRQTKLRGALSRLFSLLLCATVSASAGTISSAAAAEEIVARLSYHWSPTHHSAIHAKMFADEVNRRAEGRLRIDTFPSGQLFGIREVFAAVAAGSVELGGIVGIVSFPPLNKNYNVAAYPGLFRSYKEQRDFFLTSKAGMEIWGDITTKSNTKLLMFDPVGPVMTFSAARALDSVAAMEGLKARALIKSERPLWNALGANTVSLPTGEVYTSLQTGMIDTINSPPGSIKAYSWWEYLKFAQLPYQYFSDAYVMANGTWFNGLPQDLQDLLLEVGAEVGATSTAKIMQVGDDTLREFEERGGVVTMLKGEAKAGFDNLMNDKVKPDMADLLDATVLEAAQAFTSN
ncbi:TRAP transporter substrate-binding protein [Pelagibius sp. Alg239-R121]|uniref:TRAP transporter substrate-binding protein n=1 Tax=Pelagibius sp. Alg239-R121 TaxID=2993448 RepID=UPI0024A73E05|nr:TRAP transporter substrate-binding protein DctP [Pelagibius sp. Alg239-R121]